MFDHLTRFLEKPSKWDVYIDTILPFAALFM